MELAVEAVLQPPQDSPVGPSLDSTLQQLALHFLGGGLSSGPGGAPPPGPGEEPQGRTGRCLAGLSAWCPAQAPRCHLSPYLSSVPVHSAPLPSCSASPTVKRTRAKQQEEPRYLNE